MKVWGVNTNVAIP